MFVLKVLAMGISFLYVPLLLNVMNSYNYGLWLTITSLASWISLLDIGLGNGLRNKLSESLAKNNDSLGRSYVSTAYTFITISACIVICIFLFINPVIPWGRVLGVVDIENDYLQKLVAIVVVAIGIQFCLNLINSILYALQLPAITSLIIFLGQLFSFVFVYIAVNYFHITSLLYLVAIIATTPVLVLLISSFIIFRIKYKRIAPSIKYIKKRYIKDILTLGIKFLFIQISTIVLYQTNNLLITNILGPDHVSEYHLVFKYIFVVYTIFAIIITPIWSATTDAFARNDIKWIKMTIRHVYIIFYIACLGLIFMVLLSPYMYKFWIGDKSTMLNMSTTIIMAIYAVSQMLYGIYGYIINGIGKMYISVLMNILLSIAYIPIAYYLICNIGIPGALLAQILINIIMYIVSKIQSHKLLTGTASGIWNR